MLAIYEYVVQGTENKNSMFFFSMQQEEMKGSQCSSTVKVKLYPDEGHC